MSSFNGNNDAQGEARFVYEQTNLIDCTTREAIQNLSIRTFPPPINPEDLIAQRKNGEVPSRSPNAFLIYRRVVVKELQAQNYAYKMTDVSSMASKFWKLEPDYVKQAYLRIAGEAKNMLTKTRHKSLNFSRRKWRNQNHNNNNNNNKNNNNTRTPKTKKSSTSQSPPKKQPTTINTPQFTQSFTQEPKHQPKHQFVQPSNIFQNTIDTIEEEHQFISPSFAVRMEDVDYLFAHQSPVSDVLVYSDEESSTSTDVGIDDTFEKMTILSYKLFMINWHAQLFYNDIITNNGLMM
ncbi:hypothetical protein C1645_741759 [Glomus cerebriforme]|uniref:HMG box domain-containing protein n=1 Tax=Glomus cerebriforme TaxID=658196 RepID=A0A397SQU9_9GLOM|nr:hypothetical protein C1645_741759 [Glomus cerebriforme]